jgi:nitrate reductase beta subunit
MRRGCISLGEIKCDLCEKVIPNAKRYMAEEEVESGKSRTLRYCMDCCIKKGYAEYREEKGEKILTVFPEKEATKK